MENKEFDKKFKNQLEALSHKMAEGVSILMQSFDNKEQRIEALRRIEVNYPIEILKKVYKTAIEREDFETCDAFKDFFHERNHKL